VLQVLPWVAIGALVYLMAQNANKVKAAAPSAAGSSSGSGTSSIPACFGLTCANSWCG
jgi:hypothetical protein